MAFTTLQQVRYYGPDDPRNYPLKDNGRPLSNIDLAGTTSSGMAFSKYLPCKMLKIKGPAGLKFYLNGFTNSETDGIILGDTGVFQVPDVKALRFDMGQIRTQTVTQYGLLNIFNQENTIREPYIFIEFLYEIEDEEDKENG